jgi:hypothetical protein
MNQYPVMPTEFPWKLLALCAISALFGIVLGAAL